MELPADPYACDRCRYEWRTKTLRLCDGHTRDALSTLTHPSQWDNRPLGMERLAFICAPGDHLPGGATERRARTEGPAPLPVERVTAAPASVRGLDLDD